MNGPRVLATLAALMALQAAVTPQERWEAREVIDPYGDTVTAAVSPMAGPVDDAARLMVACDEAWVRFSRDPMMASGEPNRFQAGALDHVVGFRFNAEPDSAYAVTAWGHTLHHDLDVIRTERLLAGLKRSGLATFTVDLLWGRVSYGWPLEGVTEALAASCGG